MLPAQYLPVSSASQRPAQPAAHPLSPIPAHPRGLCCLLPSNGHTLILKELSLVHLPKLPSAAEMGVLLVLHTFGLHGIPSDIVLER